MSAMPKHNNPYTKHRLLILSLSLLLFVLALFSSFGLHWQEDVLSLLPDTDKEINAYKMLMDQFNPMDAVYVDVQLGSPAGSEALLLRSADSLSQAMNRSGLFTRMLYRWHLSDMLRTRDVLYAHRAELFTREDSVWVSSHLQPDSVVKRFQVWRRTLAESPTPFVVQEMLRDPLGVDAHLMHKLMNLQTMDSNILVKDGRLMSRDGRHALIIAYPKHRASDSFHARELTIFMEKAIQAVQNESSQKIRIAWLAGHRFSVENAKRIKRDVQLTITVSLLAIGLLALLVFSRRIYILFTLLPALFGSTVALGLMRWLLPDLSVIVIGSGAMLIGLAVDYGIHVLYHADRLDGTKQFTLSVQERMQSIRRPLLLSAATTIAAFLILRFSVLPGYRQLGLFVSLGIAAALAFVLLVLPRLILLRRHPVARQPILNISAWFPKFFTWYDERRNKVLWGLLVVSIFMAPGLFKVQFEGDVQKLNAVSEAIRRDWDNVQSVFGTSMASTFLILYGTEKETVLQNNDRLPVLLERLEANGAIEGFTSVATVFPSVQTQKENRRRWRQVFNSTMIERLNRTIRQAARQNGFRPELFAIYGSKLAQAGDSFLTKSEIRGTILQNILDMQVSGREEQSIVLTRIKLHSYQDLQKVRTSLQTAFPELLVYNGKYFVTRMVHLIFNELKRMGSMVFVLIFLIVLLYKRSFRTALVLMLPLLLSLLWTFGLMGWLGIRVNIINSIVSVFVFGLVIDYSFFMHNACLHKKNGEAHFLEHSSAAVSLSALTTLFGLSALLLASHPAMHTLGATATIGIASGLLLVLLIIPYYFCKNGREVM